MCRPSPRFPRIAALAFLTPLVALMGCFSLPKAQTAPNPAAYGPSADHAPTTPAQWAAAEQRAQAQATQGGGELVAPPSRLVTRGMFVTHDVAVSPNTCYVAALAWSFPHKAYASVSFLKNPDGTTPNAQLAGRAQRVAAPGGVLKYCADRAGTARLRVSALATSGALANNALLEYALAVAGRREGAAQTDARRQDEARRADDTRAYYKRNIAAAKERERQNRAFERRQARRRCGSCRAAYYRCEGSRPNVSVNWSSRCGRRFNECVWGGGVAAYQKRGQRNPCGAP